MGDDNPVAMPLLHFDRPLVIVGGGAVDFELLRSLHADGARLIAADGGADICAEAGMMPEAIIGDMDSVSNVAAWSSKTQIIKLDEQLTTDFEKCLYSTEAPVTVAMGMTGKRFDHTLAALDAVSRYAAGRRIILVDEADIALAVVGSLSFSVAAGERVSVHPLGRIAFATSRGLDYPLDGLVLEPGVRTGTSNAATEGRFEINPEPGEKAPWLLILDRKYLKSLMRVQR